jgi:glycosyltransferase involved in cell wall biosynthesis
MTEAPPLRVALDARKLHDGGIGTYIRGLLDAFAAEPDGDTVVALVDPEHVSAVTSRGGVSAMPVRAGKYGVLEHVRVPAAARRAGATLLHEPHYTLPLGWGGRSVVTVHDLTHLRFPQFYPPGASLYARAMAGLATRRAQVVITDSEAGRRDVIERLGVSGDKVRSILLGLSPVFSPVEPEALAHFRALHQLPSEYVLYVGARKRHKNLELLLDAFALLPERERPKLVLAGVPWDGDHPLARRARDRGVEPSIQFAPAIADDHALAALYSAAALYVQPSLAEGFGLPPLEALACGAPVLSSDAGSLPEVLGNAGRFLPPSNPDAWAAAIREMLSDSSGRAERSARGRAHAAGFTWARAASETRRAYADAMV